MITAAQQKVLDFVASTGRKGADKGQLAGAKCDVRAANNLVRAGFLTETSGVYRSYVKTEMLPPAEKTVKNQVGGTVITRVEPGKKKEPKAKKEKTEADRDFERTCLCGCGVVVTKRANFRAGHDAKVKSRVIGCSRDGSKMVVHADLAEYLRTAPWMTPELRKAVHL